MPKAFTDCIAKLEPLFLQLNDSIPQSLSSLSAFPKKPAIYVLFENSVPLYTGRTKNLRQRMSNHTSGRPEQSTFAFKLARETSGFKKASYTPKNSRKELMSNIEFKNSFLQNMDRIRNMAAKYVIVEEDIAQHLFEVYCAMRLQTAYNEFRTS